MSKLLCWMFDHNRIMTSWRLRVCMRCGRQETLRNLGHVLAWEEVTTAPAVRA